MTFGQKGFSIVGALVTLGVVGGVSLVLMQQQSTSSKKQSKDNADQLVNSAANIIQTALASRAICSSSLRGKGVGDDVPALFDAQANPTNINAEVTVGPNLFNSGETLPNNITITMKIINHEGKDYLLALFNLNPTGGKKMFGADVVGRRFPLVGEKDTATQKYISCYSEMYNTIKDAHRRSCLDMGGVWNGKCALNSAAIYYDATKGALVANPVGTPYGETLVDFP